MFLAEYGDTPLDNFEQAAMQWLNSHRRGPEALSPKTTGRRLTSVRAYAAWAGLPTPDLAEYCGPTPSKSIPHPLPEGVDGVRRLIAAARFDYHAAYIALCGLGGLRSSEAVSVRPKDFDLHSMTLLILGKGDKERRVPISPEAWETLVVPTTRAFAEAGRPVVGLHDRFARRMLTQLGARIGLQRAISSHDLRATFATAVFDHTKDIRLVQELLGHSSVETTQVYTAVAMEKMRTAVVLP